MASVEPRSSQLAAPGSHQLPPPPPPKPPVDPKPPVTPTPSQGLDLNALLALLAADQQAPTATPVVDIGEQLDLGAPLETNPFAKQQTQSKMAEGGSIDDLLALLQQRG